MRLAGAKQYADLWPTSLSASSFEAAHRRVAVHAEEQGVAEIAGVLQTGDVAGVQQVEAVVGDDEFFAAGANYISPGRQLVPRDELVAEIHAAILPAPTRMATIYPKE